MFCHNGILLIYRHHCMINDTIFARIKSTHIFVKIISTCFPAFQTNLFHEQLARISVLTTVALTLNLYVHPSLESKRKVVNKAFRKLRKLSQDTFGNNENDNN